MNRTTRLEAHAVDIARRIATEQAARSSDEMREHADMKIDRGTVDRQWYTPRLDRSIVRGPPLRGSDSLTTH